MIFGELRAYVTITLAGCFVVRDLQGDMRARMERVILDQYERSTAGLGAA